MQTETNSPFRAWVGACGLIFAAAFLAYAPALTAGWVWNDSDYVTAPALQSWAGLGRIWCEVGATQQYYPVLHSAFWLEHRLWGDAALGYHLINVAFHATSACLFSLVLLRLGAKAVAAGLGGLIFALHPVCVESVAWVTEQKNTLSTVFYLASALGYLRFCAQRRAAVYFLAFGGFVLAVLSKSVAATLPGALLVVLWWRHGRLDWRRDIGPLLPWLGVGAAAGLFTGWVERKYLGAAGPAFALTGAERLALAGRASWFYLAKALWPVRLIFIYPRWPTPLAGVRSVLPDLALLAVLAALWVLRGRSRTPLAGLLVFLGGLFPLLGFFNIYAFVFSFVADHWQYLALLGLIAAVAAGWSAALAAARRWQRALLYGLALAGVGTCGVLTRRECRNYRDPENFYHTILARNSAAWMPHNNLGAAFFLAGKLPEARDEFAAAVRLKPDYADGHYNLGKTLWSLRAYAPAQAEMAEALRLNPSDARAADYLGQCLAATGHWPEAIAAFARARQLGGDNHLLRYNLAVAENNLGTLLGNRGQFSEALPHFELAVAWNPTYVQAHENLARALIALGRAEAGAAEFRAAARLQATGRN